MQRLQQLEANLEQMVGRGVSCEIILDNFLMKIKCNIFFFPCILEGISKHTWHYSSRSSKIIRLYDSLVHISCPCSFWLFSGNDLLPDICIHVINIIMYYRLQ